MLQNDTRMADASISATVCASFTHSTQSTHALYHWRCFALPSLLCLLSAPFDPTHSVHLTPSACEPTCTCCCVLRSTLQAAQRQHSYLTPAVLCVVQNSVTAQACRDLLASHTAAACCRWHCPALCCMVQLCIIMSQQHAKGCLEHTAHCCFTFSAACKGACNIPCQHARCTAVPCDCAVQLPSKACVVIL